ncbi:MAG TPA: methyl-accepting chemotaxis protein [Myxococcota bacterium]|jgi:methyl-accepting chemotaxis protein
MKAGKEASLRESLARAMMLCTGSALGASLIAMLGLQVNLVSRNQERELANVGAVISTSTQAAVEFDDPEAANEALATLAADPDVAFAAVVKPGGGVFAAWGELPKNLASLSKQDSEVSLIRNHAHFRTEISNDKGTLATLLIGKRLDVALAQLGQITGVMIAIGLAGFALAWAISSRLRESLAKPLVALASTAEAMASGDLSAEALVDRDDEIGGLAKSFNRMTAGLRALVAQVRESTVAVSHESQRLAAASESMSGEAHANERAALGMASSVEELSAQMSELSRTASHLAQNAEHASSATSATDQALSKSARGINSLFETVDESAASVLQLTTAVRQIAGNAGQLDVATRATSQSITALDASLRQVEGNARESRDATREAAEAARGGERAVGAAITGMGELAESFGSVQRIVGDLAERSKAIEQVLRVIEEVADQTNLLALNAAIIASQAGSHGHAFSVVASEVKSLAKRTAGSAREIGASIGAVLKGIDAAVAATQSGAERVREGTRRSEEAGDALRAISASAERSSTAVGAIASATEEQVSGVETVASELLRVKNMVDEIARATREQDNAGTEIQRGIETVRELAEELKRTTGELSEQSRLSSHAVGNVAASLAQIRDGSEAQRAAGVQILEATQHFRGGASETTRRAEEMRTTVDALRERSSALERELARFR